MDLYIHIQKVQKIERSFLNRQQETSVIHVEIDFQNDTTKVANLQELYRQTANTIEAYQVATDVEEAQCFVK